MFWYLWRLWCVWLSSLLQVSLKLKKFKLIYVFQYHGHCRIFNGLIAIKGTITSTTPTMLIHDQSLDRNQFKWPLYLTFIVSHDKNRNMKRTHRRKARFDTSLPRVTISDAKRNFERTICVQNSQFRRGGGGRLKGIRAAHLCTHPAKFNLELRSKVTDLSANLPKSHPVVGWGRLNWTSERHQKGSSPTHYLNSHPHLHPPPAPAPPPPRFRVQ